MWQHHVTNTCLAHLEANTAAIMNEHALLEGSVPINFLVLRLFCNNKMSSFKISNVS